MKELLKVLSYILGSLIGFLLFFPVGSILVETIESQMLVKTFLVFLMAGISLIIGLKISFGIGDKIWSQRPESRGEEGQGRPNYLPGFRSKSSLKKLLASLYYLASVYLVTIDAATGLFALSLPLIILSLTGFFTMKKQGRKFLRSFLVLALGILIAYISLVLPSAYDSEVIKIRESILREK